MVEAADSAQYWTIDLTLRQKKEGVKLLEFKMVGHASVQISSDEFSILTDPWFGESLNYGAFHAFPPITPLSDDEINRVKAIHISHTHADHLCPETLSRFNRDLPILIAKYESKRLFHRIQSMGFTKIIEIQPGFDGLRFGPFHLYALVPEVETRALDSALVVQETNTRQLFLLNNDCILSPLKYLLVRRLLGRFQGCFLGYNPYFSPMFFCYDFSQCQPIDLTVEEGSRRHYIHRWSIASVQETISLLNPKWFVPYASGVRFLNRDLLYQNEMFVDPNLVMSRTPDTNKQLQLQPGECIDESGNLISTSGPVSPINQSSLPELSPALSGLIDIEPKKAEYTKFFDHLLARMRGIWKSPMRVQFDIHGLGELISVGETDSPDIIVEYPARAIDRVLREEMSFENLHFTFQFRVRILKYIEGQYEVHRWKVV